MAWNPSRNNSIMGRAKTSILVVTMPVDWCCRIPGCKQAGLYFKRLDKHLKRCHPAKSRQDNFVSSVNRPADHNLVKKHWSRKTQVWSDWVPLLWRCGFTTRQTHEKGPQNYNQGAGKERVDGRMFVFFWRRLRRRRQLPFWWNNKNC